MARSISKETEVQQEDEQGVWGILEPQKESSAETDMERLFGAEHTKNAPEDEDVLSSMGAGGTPSDLAATSRGYEPSVAEDVPREPKKVKYDLVDGCSAASSPGSVGSMQLSDLVPATVSSEALRLTEKSVFKFPWEKGRMSSIFSQKDLVKCPPMRLQPGIDSMVQMQVSVGEGSSDGPRSEGSSRCLVCEGCEAHAGRFIH